MKLLRASLTALFATLAVAQNVYIVSPKPGTKLALGHEVTVQIARPASDYPPTEVGLVIGSISCGTSTCPSPTEAAGGVLYDGAYKPESSEHGVAYQNFSVVLPDFEAARGPAQINVIRLALVGGIPHPILDTTTVSIELV